MSVLKVANRIYLTVLHESVRTWGKIWNVRQSLKNQKWWGSSGQDPLLAAKLDVNKSCPFHAFEARKVASIHRTFTQLLTPAAGVGIACRHESAIRLWLLLHKHSEPISITLTPHLGAASFGHFNQYTLLISGQDGNRRKAGPGVFIIGRTTHRRIHRLCISTEYGRRGEANGRQFVIGRAIQRRKYWLRISKKYGPGSDRVKPTRVP